MEQWTWAGGDKWTRGDREVNSVAAGLYQARKLGYGIKLDVVDGTLYRSPKAAKEAADRL